MSRRAPDDELSLFDLPLGEGREEETPSRRERAAPRPRDEWDAPAEPELPLFRTPAEPAAAPTPSRSPREFPRPLGPPKAAAPPPVETPAAFFQATVGARLVAGLADFAVHLLLVLGLLFGLRALGVELQLGDIPALVAFVLVFSFLYYAIPLAFWGRTPGMRWAHLVARAEDGGGLNFGETARRWAGSLLTFALLGLPLLFSFGGRRSLADRVSQSRTFSV
ncbi:MAG: RDD family protein [Thermoanaerobaculia bacterium]|nr:RDD family protein [Thermoanaerobaculia bacterium]